MKHPDTNYTLPHVIGRQGRQGDVLLIPIERRDTSSMQVKQNKVVALGESSGHRHEIFGGALYEDGRVTVLDADEDTVIKHLKGAEWTKEHFDIAVEPGMYQVVIQRQWEPEGWSYVAD